MEVCVLDQQSTLSISTEQVQSLVREVLSFEACKCDEVAIHFVPTSTICELHEVYFNDPSSTDCISFPVSPDTDDINEYHTLGDVFVCTDTASTYAQEHELNPYEELSLYVVHGLLHLMGYDDISEIDRKEMRAAEDRHIRNLKSKALLLQSV